MPEESTQVANGYVRLRGRIKGPFTYTCKGGPDVKRGPLKFLTLVRGP